jgi:uncharacterized membrane protein (DUF106 family)
MSAIASFLAGLYGFYNTIFNPILALGPYVSLGIFSASLAGLFSIIYWFLLDIEKQKEIKEKINEKQEKMKEARKNDKADKASEHMQETMKHNQKMMMLNFKPMIATMIFVALIFPWLGATFAPTVELTQQGNNTYTGEFVYNGKSGQLTVVNSTNQTVEFDGQQTTLDGSINAYGVTWDITKFGEAGGGFLGTSIKTGTVLKMNARFVELPFSIPLAGSALNWLGFYILIAMPLTFIFRKMLGVA